MPRPPSPSRPLVRYLRRFVYFLMFLLILAALLPTIVAKTPLRSVAVSWALGNLPVSVKVGSLSLNWWSQVAAEDVEVYDSQNRLIARLPRVTLDRNLAQLALSPRNVGKIHLDRPTADVTFSGNSSNLEELIKGPAREPGASGSTRTPSKATFQVEVAQGTIRVVDEDAKQEWQLTNVDASLSHQGSAPLSGRAKASVAGAAQPGAVDVAFANNTAQLLLNKLPVTLARPFLRRAYPDIGCGGVVDGNVSLQFGTTAEGTPLLKVATNAAISNLELHGGPVGDDHLTIRKLETRDLSADYNGDRLDLRCPSLECELGRVEGILKIRPDRPLAATLSEPNSFLRFDVNLAACVQRMPKTFNLHKDVRLDSGSITFDAASVADGSGALWKGTLKTTELRGARGGKTLLWQDPIDMTFAIKQSPKSAVPEIKSMTCESKFVKLKGSTTPTTVWLTASVNLGQVAGPLGQFVDLGKWPLGGSATASLVAKEKSPGLLTYRLDASLDQFQWGPWTEKKLTINGEADVKSETEQRRFDKPAHLHVVSGDDHLTVQLLDAWTVSNKGQTGGLYVKLEGDFARWQERLRPFVAALASLPSKGNGTCEAWVNFTTDKDGIDLKETQLKTKAINAHTKKLRIDTTRRAAAGVVVFRAELAQLKELLSPAPGDNVWAGVMAGKADLKTGEDGFTVDVDSSVENAAFGPAKAPYYRDPSMKLIAKGHYAAKAGVFTFEKATLQSQLGVVEGRASLAKLDTTMDLDATGTLSYDLAGAQPIVRTYLGATASIAGKERRDFRVAGPLRPKGTAPGATVELTALSGATGIKWTSLKAYGADAGVADFKINLHNGWLKADPVVTSLNQGRLKLVPSMRLSPEPQVFELPAGSVVERAKITPQMCASALGYALPLLANVAQAEGELSLQLTGARVPLADAAKAEVQGVLMLHHAKVGPSPLVAEISSLIKATTPYSVIRDNQVKFKVEKGRVYHEDLQLVLPDNFIVKTSGSVGFDGSLDMIVEMPLPVKLVGNLKLPPAIARQPVRLPIGGTVEHPRIDSNGLKHVLEQAGRDAAGNLIRDGLNKLLTPKK